MRRAPTHHGIEGSEYGIVALALSLKSVTDSSAGLATSGLFTRVPGNKLKFDPKGATVVDLGASFLGFPEGARYNYTNTPQGALGARTFKFAADPGMVGVAIIRVVFTDRFDHSWVVYMDPASAAAGSFTLPTPPGAFTDRTYFNDNTVAQDSRSPLLVQALRLNDNPVAPGAAIPFQKLIELNSTNADRMVDFTTAFAFISYGRPEVKWMTPAANASVAAGSAVKVKVTGFKIGTASTDDGFVRITTSGVGACTTPMDGTTDASAGKGEISVNLPAGCTGTGLTLTATLYSNAPAALSPPVSTVVTGVNIN
ncbi:MAG: hypothetical protein ACYC8T_37985 [Myxococcaceae bacterium]